MKQKHLTALAWGLTLTGISILVSTIKIANEAARTERTHGANASALMSIVHRLSPNLKEMKEESEEEVEDVADADEPIPAELMKDEPALNDSGKEASLKR